jgi:hypothetical protein
MDPRRSQIPLNRFFSGLAEYTFQTRLGMADPPVIEYIGALLTRFVHCDAIYKVRNPAGRRLYEVAEMLIEAEARVGDPKREVHRHVGDFVLFWTGLFPEAAKRNQRRAQLDGFLDYLQQGKRAYYIASTMRTDENASESDVLERLSHEFELCVYGLNELRKELDTAAPPPGSDWTLGSLE